MPVIFRHGGFSFFFFSNEGKPREPLHVHVRKADGDAKFWLYPSVAVSDSFGFNASTLNELARIVESNRALIESRWHEHFGN